MELSDYGWKVIVGPVPQEDFPEDWPWNPVQILNSKKDEICLDRSKIPQPVSHIETCFILYREQANAYENFVKVRVQPLRNTFDVYIADDLIMASMINAKVSLNQIDYSDFNYIMIYIAKAIFASGETKNRVSQLLEALNIDSKVLDK